MGTARQGDNDGYQTRLRYQANPTATLAFQSVWGRVMRKFVKAGGTRFTEHDIRGKVATDIDAPYQAQKLLAHSSIKMTERYIKQRKKTVIQPHSREKKE